MEQCEKDLVSWVIGNYVDRNWMFTSVEIANEIKRSGVWIRNFEVGAFIADNLYYISSGKSKSYCVSVIKVDSGKGGYETAACYHPDNLSAENYLNRDLKAITPDQFKVMEAKLLKDSKKGESMDLVVLNDKNVPITTSLAVAETFGKEHKHIMRDIKSLGCSDSFNGSNFGLISYKDSMNRDKPCYEMTRDGWVALVMGFNGERAWEFKEKYFAAFNAMEKELIQPKHEIPQTYSEALMLAATQTEKVERLEGANKQLAGEAKVNAPKVGFHDTIKASKACISMGKFSKFLKVEGISLGRNKLYALLRDHGYLMSFPKENKNVPYQKYIDQGIFKPDPSHWTSKNDNDYIYSKTLVTGKGQIYLVKKIKEIL